MLKIFLFVVSFGFVFGVTNDLTSDQSRIINGQVATVGQYPWMVAITITRTQTTMFCGGTLIARNRILTAAHCVFGDVRRLSLNFGGIRLGSNEEGRQTVLIPEMNDTIVINPYYNPTDMEYDIAIIRLVAEIDLIVNRIQLIRLPENTLGEAASIRVSGWGMASNAASGLSDVLRFADLRTTNTTYCRQYAFPGVDTGIIVCAHGTPSYGNNICHGDFGSPIFIYNAQLPEQSTLVGVASFLHSSGCGADNSAGFTRVFEQVTWIRQEIARQ